MRFPLEISLFHVGLCIFRGWELGAQEDAQELLVFLLNRFHFPDFSGVMEVNHAAWARLKDNRSTRLGYLFKKVVLCNPFS